MKLKKCYIFSFGKLKDFSYDFDDKLTCINEENGFGKTTLSIFLKSMFYGLNDSKKNIIENERKKFAPWNSTEKFGGYLIFEGQEKQYKIERFFGTKFSEDTAFLTDLASGEKTAIDNDFGRSFFDVDQDNFVTTAFIGNLTENSKNTALSSFGLDSSFEEEKYLQAVSIIEKKMKLLKARGEKGVIADLKKQIFEVREKIRLAKNANLEISEIDENLAKKRAKINEIKDRIFALNKSLASISKSEFALDEKAKLEDVFSKNIPDMEELKRFEGLAVELTSVENNKNLVLLDISKGENECQNSSKKIKNKKNLIAKIILLIISSVFFIFGGVFSVFNITYGLISLGLGVIAFAFSFLIKVKGNALDTESKANLIKAREELCGYQTIIERNNQLLREFLLKFKLPTFSGFLNAIKFLEECLNRYNDLCNSTDLETDIFRNSTAKRIEDELRQKEQEFELCNESIAITLAEREKQHALAETLLDNLNREADLVKELEKFNSEYEVLENANKFLKLANENLKIRYKKPLEEAINKYKNFVTDKIESVSVDLNANVTILEKNGGREIDFYSEGFKSVVSICKRFALTDVIFKKEKPFMVLDDPFCNLDKEKILGGLDLIKNLSKSYQIIYFTCHESRAF